MRFLKQCVQETLFSRKRIARLFVATIFLTNLCSARHDPSHALFTEVLKDHVTNGEVNYAGIREDERFATYLSSLKDVDPSSINNPNERMAFWINAYNAFTIRLILDHYPVASIRDIQVNGIGPWDMKWIVIAGKNFSLNQIEHDVLLKQFDEPRIHAALVCAARGCPPLRPEAYVGKNLNAQLEDNSRVFVNDPGKNRFDEQSNTLYPSELFSWYADDFVPKYGSAEKFVFRMLGIQPRVSPTIKYLPYDWKLNGR